MAPAGAVPRVAGASGAKRRPARTAMSWPAPRMAPAPDGFSPATVPIIPSRVTSPVPVFTSSAAIRPEWTCVS